MENLYFREVFQYPITEFKNHLEQTANERIIFSGKYGIGKTKFLNDFFDVENQKNIYGDVTFEVYRLCPVHYSIASNEDIIRYIKYDLTIEMLKKKANLEEVTLNLLDTFPEYLKKNLHKVIAGLVYMIPKLGKEIVECFDRIDKLKEEFLQFHDTANVSPGDKLIKYIEQLEIKEGSIYENDVITKIISNIISKVQERQSILIIDDVDRLDPEHVFRILNVFASHFEEDASHGNKNKFGFDKIIIVCDFNNIRNIFHHRYGAEVDFMGYIDKFYSSDVYYFDNKKAVKGIVKNILESLAIEVHENDDKTIYKQLYLQNKFLLDIINTLLIQGFISLRNILKLYNKRIEYHYEKIEYDSHNSEIFAWVNPIVMQLKVIRGLFGDYRNMRNVFEKVSFDGDFITKHEARFGEFLYILSSKVHNYSQEKEFLFYFDNKPIVLEVKRKIENEQFEYAYLYEWNGSQTNDEKPIKGIPVKANTLQLKKALLDSVELLHKTSYLK